MKKWLLTSVALAALAGVIVSATGSAQSGQPRTLTLFEDVPHESSTLVDNAPRSPAKNPDSRRFRLSAGDELVGALRCSNAEALASAGPTSTRWSSRGAASRTRSFRPT